MFEKLISNFIGRLIGGYTGSGVTPQTLSRVQKEWENVEIALKSKNISQLRQALISADKALDNVLKDLVAGETMGERLKSARDKYHPHTYDNIWQAHKLRNTLVHEAGVEIPNYVLSESIMKLKEGITELGVSLR